MKGNMNLTNFISKIKQKDIEGNRTYLSIKIGSFRYGQSYQNATNTIEDMINRFAVFYYPIFQEDQKHEKIPSFT